MKEGWTQQMDDGLKPNRKRSEELLIEVGFRCG